MDLFYKPGSTILQPEFFLQMPPTSIILLPVQIRLPYISLTSNSAPASWCRKPCQHQEQTSKPRLLPQELNFLLIPFGFALIKLTSAYRGFNIMFFANRIRSLL